MKHLKHIKINVTCIPNCETQIKKVFYQILDHYCKAYSVECTKDKVTVNICFAEYHENDPHAGVTIDAPEFKKIHVQIRDPFLNGWEDNMYTMGAFVGVLCHEIIHVCQHLTGRKGFSIPRWKFDKGDKVDEYFFDSYEIEARVLADYYATKYGNALI
jgi:hypothetical protein